MNYEAEEMVKRLSDVADEEMADDVKARMQETARLHLEKIQQIYEEGLNSESDILGEKVEAQPQYVTQSDATSPKNTTLVKPLRKRPLHIPKSAMMIQTTLFVLVFFGISIVGLCMPLRPTESEIERRTLTEMPKFSWETLLSGEYTEQLSTWYADTFPFRETLLTGYSRVKNLFGIQNEQLIGDAIIADEIPEVPDDEDESTASGSDATDETTSAEQPTETTPEVTPEQTTPQPTTPQPTTPQSSEQPTPGTNSTVPENIGSVYIYGEQAFSLYGFSLQNSNQYASLINQAQTALNGKATVYSMLIPLAYGVQLDADIWEKMGWSDEEAAIKYMYSKMNDEIKTVSVYQNLLAHKDEYLYFRTDHHWTALGAYYAYECFAKEKGITTNPLSSYETRTYDNFLGTLYAQSNESQVLASNPDSIIAYVPKATNRIKIWQKNGETMNWPIINDVSQYKSAAKYSCFIGGDQPFSVITNENLNDGSSVLLVKESYGNAFAPFLVDHYQNVYIADFRYCKEKLIDLVETYGIQDVIFLNNLNSAGSTSLHSYLQEFITK